MRRAVTFENWLAALSLDAARTDLCPNLAYIPKHQLFLLWADGCAPTSEAIIQRKIPGQSRANPAAAAGAFADAT
jgi:hypothetical protein